MRRGRTARCRTSPAVVDAAVDHPDRRVRGRLAEAPASLALTAAQWSRLVLGESSGARRELLLQAAVMAGRGLTREAYGTLAADPFGPVREELARMPALPLVSRCSATRGRRRPPPGTRCCRWPSWSG
ncbi:hypothetical protein ACFVT6_11100 [Streptomyces sp. NPDC058049]|uniref:hypothetical protein n=1 Tax=Streptomyces sp. NPDC058049 TaxID=3346314 RepID=UPI0036F171D3